AVEDLAGGRRALRARILAPPFRRLDVPAHLTLVHPRTSPAGPEAWRELRGARFDAAFTVTELLLTATSAAGCTVLAAAPLRP
ncbi:hypothetical protein, partial [Pseudonocardia nigra]|uniref:hypothetical protein n=1 Tax=Pseudonocardia nigra TaxID=1921578 RepID=UPI001C5F1B44